MVQSTVNQSITLNRTRNHLINPFWAELPWLGSESVNGYLHTEEITFWQQILSKYLAPLDKDPEDERRIQNDLIGLRNNAGFAFFMLNAIWIILQFQCEYVATKFTELMIDISRPFGRSGTKVQALGLLFMLFFASCMIIQFLTMIFHRWGTFIEILASTKLFEKHRKYRLKPGSDIAVMNSQEVAEILKEMDIELVLPSSCSVDTTMKNSVTFQMEPPIQKVTKRKEDLTKADNFKNAIGNKKNDDENIDGDDEVDDDPAHDVYNEPPIDYLDHPLVQEADESRLRQC